MVSVERQKFAFLAAKRVTPAKTIPRGHPVHRYAVCTRGGCRDPEEDGVRERAQNAIILSLWRRRR